MQDEWVELLVINAKQGDKHAFASLYKHFVKPMRRYALIRVNDTATAEDLVQNVWIKVGQKLVQLNTVSLFKSWIYRALRWEILDWAKSAHQRTQAASETSEALHAEDDLDLSAVAPLLLSLNEQDRDVVELHYLSGLSVAETALALSIPIGTVKSRLFRARDHLRAKLNEDTNNE